MAIPDFQSLMLPVLKHLGDKAEHHWQETTNALAKLFNLTPEEQKVLLPSGTDFLFRNRVGWAITYLKKAGLIESTRRGHSRITERGLKLLDENLPEINIRYLKKYPEFLEFQSIKKDKSDGETEVDDKEQLNPDEAIEIAYGRLRKTLALDLLQAIKKSTPGQFERLVVDLLLAMGYGGNRQAAGEAIGGSGDEGIDGIIREDRLGLDVVYIQAKRWENPVSRPEIQKFAGALQGKKAKKGVFITLSSFTREAREFAEKIESKVVLIDGEMLAQLMIDYNIGVTPGASFTAKKVDRDYFADE